MKEHDDSFIAKREKRQKTWRFKSIKKNGDTQDPTNWIPSAKNMDDRIRNLNDLEALRKMVYPELQNAVRMDRKKAKKIQ